MGLSSHMTSMENVTSLSTWLPCSSMTSSPASHGMCSVSSLTRQRKTPAHPQKTLRNHKIHQKKARNGKVQKMTEKKQTGKKVPARARARKTKTKIHLTNLVNKKLTTRLKKLKKVDKIMHARCTL